ncbi:PTS sugar transporter subunit IIA [Pediococcus sp. M21F004]|uniref:PTS sugar transporter subunit IIA n=1 Tax=Pediococcus sp. M21F004 TaxID=3390033 RepID=UPI003DA72154
MLLDKKMFNENIMLFDDDAVTREAAITKLSNKLLDRDIVKSSFLNAILIRENNYPTGLQLSNNLGVAIPHTDADKVNQDQIAFMSFKNPITFRQMASETEVVPVNMIFILCLKSPHDQLDMLQNLMALFTNNEFMMQLIKCHNQKEFFHVLEN